jgi:hypothetical protein
MAKMNKYIQGYRNKKTDKQTELLQTLIDLLKLFGLVAINIIFLLLGYWIAIFTCWI